ncbi:hypothetical protein [Methanosphaerula subterraneus]|uniref:hypothetical protein n=1 Tax=Methanosphaerula subterraneus TaxID=3350244 RepID=UPI003F875FF1
MTLRSFIYRIWRSLPWILLLLVVAAGIAPLLDPNPAPWLTPAGETAVLGLFILYVIYAVRHWSAGNRWTAVLMVTTPLLATIIATTAFTDATQLATVLAFAFVVAAFCAGILCSTGAWAARVIRDRTSHRHHRDRFPSGSVAFIAVILLSGVALNAATPSYLDQNVALITQSAYPVLSALTPALQYDITYPTVTVRPAVVGSNHVTLSSADAATLLPTRAAQEGGGASYTTDPTTRSLPFTVRGRSGTVGVTLYGGLSQYLDNKRPAFYGDYREYVNEPAQAETIRAIANALRSQAGSGDDAARAAISLVQHIPYDDARLSVQSSDLRHPYQVLYDNTGVCSEKSVLLAALLKELGYGVALLSFDSQNHMAVGILCPAQYSYRGTGYAFVESTRPTIPTDADGNYVGVGDLTTMPTVISIAAGSSFATIGEEAADANEYRSLTAGSVLPSAQYARYQAIVKKYDIQ